MAEHGSTSGMGPTLPILGALAVALVAGLLVWVLVIRDGENGIAPQAGEAPALVSEDDLRAIADELDQPIYWAGRIDGTQLELTRTDDDHTYVRYLSEDAEAGTPDPGFLTVGTYRFEDAERALEEVAEREGAMVVEGDAGRAVVTSEETPTSAYFSSPDGRFQVEVYDPDPARAIELASSGRVRPIG
jgi:hypothetical protein